MAEINLAEGLARSEDIVVLANAITALQQSQIELLEHIAAIRQPQVNSRGMLIVDTNGATTYTQITGYRSPTTGGTIDASIIPAQTNSIAILLTAILHELQKLNGEQ